MRWVSRTWCRTIHLDNCDRDYISSPNQTAGIPWCSHHNMVTFPFLRCTIHNSNSSRSSTSHSNRINRYRRTSIMGRIKWIAMWTILGNPWIITCKWLPLIFQETHISNLNCALFHPTSTEYPWIQFAEMHAEYAEYDTQHGLKWHHSL